MKENRFLGVGIAQIVRQSHGGAECGDEDVRHAQ